MILLECSLEYDSKYVVLALVFPLAGHVSVLQVLYLSIFNYGILALYFLLGFGNDKMSKHMLKCVKIHKVIDKNTY